MSARDALVARVRRTLAGPDTVLLVGAGISCSAGLPSWKELLLGLANHVEACGHDATLVRQHVEAANFQTAASFAASQLDQRQLGEAIRRACQSDRAQPSNVHRALVRLGPTCFLTTNYDQLIERAIEEHRPNDRARVVTNRQIPETADIITAQARNFVFKYHGDVMDVDSIILSREQYRELYGRFKHALEAIKIILATRPIVIVGFGMNDPDFLAVKDMLISDYSGHAGEHYAIMPDVSNLERDIWKRSYNVDIVTYATDSNHPHGKHGSLLDVLKDLEPRATAPTHATPSRDERLVKLMRLAARMMQLRPQNAIELPLKVRSRSSRTGKTFSNATKTLNILPELLRTHVKSIVLTGEPGSGKTFALRAYTAEIGAALHSACLDDTPDVEQKPVAIYVDLASYAGNVRTLLQEQLPTGMLLDEVLQSRPCTILLDAVNEIPREHQDSGEWEADILQFVNATNTRGCRLVLSVRDGLSMTRLNLPVYTVDRIEESFVIEHFRGRRLPAIFDQGAMVSLFTKPSFFSLAYNRTIDIDRIVTARDVYASLFEHVNVRWAAAHASRLDFVSLLSPIAFDAIRAGHEHIPVSEIHERCTRVRASLSGEQAIDFLVAEGILLVRPGLRVTFFHQSVTEFLASIEIAQRYRQSAEVIEEILRDRRWDHATLFALSSLPKGDAAVLFDRITAVDMVLALRATQFVRDGRSLLIAAVLEKLSRSADEWTAENDLEHILDVADALASLHVGPEHRRELDELSRKGGPLGGVAAGLLFKLSSDESTIIALLNEFDDDYGFITSLVGTVRDHASYPFVHMLVYWMRENYLPNASRSRRRLDGLSRVGELIQVLAPRDAEKLVLEFIGAEGYVREALYEGLKAWDSPFARKCLTDLIKSGAYDAAWALRTNLTYYSDRAAAAEFEVDPAFADAIVDGAAGDDTAHWALHVCRSLNDKNHSWHEALTRSASTRLDSAGQMLLEIFLSDDEERIARRLAELIASSDRLTDGQLLAIGRSRPWRKLSADASFSILLTENCRMSEGVLSALGGGMDRTTARPFAHKPFSWWLQWMDRCESSGDEMHRTCAHRIGAFLAKSDWTMGRMILQEFNRPSLPEATFRMMGKHIIAQMADVSTLSLSDAALRRLLESPETAMYDDEMGRPLLGLLATENFVIHQLMPLAMQRELGPAARRHLSRILEVAGRRHRRRYDTSR